MQEIGHRGALAEKFRIGGHVKLDFTVAGIGR